MAHFALDIETGPLPWEQIAPLYVPPAVLPPWDSSMVKYGQTKDPAKRNEKYTEVKAAYNAKLAAEKQAVADHRSEWAGKAALSPVTGRILAIGVKRNDVAAVIGEDGESEAEIIEKFWSLYRKYAASSRFIGYCSNSFDFPFIVWRSVFHGIVIPETAWDKTGRYPAYHFVDLIDRLPNRGFSEQSRKLTKICEWLGIGGKPDGIDGSDFARLWAGNPENRQQAIGYVLNDLDLTWKLAERMGVIQ